ncbi:MAG: MFS transporter [Oscillospiraceae bacterium]|nr:MFS transporter [Oscillospiraceae bacterium]
MKKLFDKENPKTPLIFYLFYFAVFCGGSVSGNFMSLYLTEAGIPVKTLGVLSGVIMIVSLITLPLFGRLADNARSKNIIMDIGYLFTIVMYILFMVVKNVVVICILRLIYGLTATPIMSLYDTITMENCRKHGWEYGPIRMVGTIGFSLMALFAGYAMKGNVREMFPMTIVCYAVTMLFGMMFPTSYRTEVSAGEGTGEAGKEAGQKGNVYALLKSRKIRNVLIMFFVYNISATVNLTYFANYVRELGGSLEMVGIANAILGFSELPFHLGPGKRWLQRIGVEKSMLVVLAVGVFRWTVCALTKDPTVLMWTMILNGIQLVPVIIGVAEFLYDQAPEGLKVTAQTSLRSSASVAAMLAADFGGSAMFHLFEKMGQDPYRNIYLSLIPLCVIGILAGLISLRRSGDEKAGSEA